MTRLFLILAFCSPLPLAASSSWITSRPDDPQAVTVSASEFGAHADGTSDDTHAIQSAIDKAALRGHEGIVFLPAGRYRISATIYVWPGIRVFGCGATRPVLLLGDDTPGFQKGVADMVIFSGANLADRKRAGSRVPFPPPGSVPPNDTIADANPNTFYSAMSNIDVEIGAGNPAAIAIRFHVAQHSYLSHMNFHIGAGLAALTQVGNEAEDLHFYGGRYGILTEKTSPAWQFTLLDSTFEGQRDAGIREHEAGLTLIHDSFANEPTAIDIDPHYSDQLWAKDCRFENISGPMTIISNEKSPLTEVGFANAVLNRVPVFALFRESGKTIAGKGSQYRVPEFTYGVIVKPGASVGEIGMRYDAVAFGSMPDDQASAIRALPPSSEWVSVRTLGAKGDGESDDTKALQKAIDSHRVLYLPSGHYVVRDTLHMNHDTVMIGLHPTATQIDLLDSTPGFEGVGTPRPVLDAPAGGNNVLSGIGIFTGGNNARATGVLWKSGAESLIDDVRFLGGHGSGTNPYNNNHTADPDVHKRWDGQYPSLWIADGGGGTFADIWTPNTFAQAGFYVSNTTTPGHVYELSNEHHVRNEIKLDHVENWEFDAPQTEEESGESPDALSMELDFVKNITIANYHGYRVTRSRAPFPSAVRMYHAENIHFRNVHVNAESGYGICDKNGCGTFLRVSKYPYENSIEDVTHHWQVREREFAALDVGSEVTPESLPLPAGFSSGVKRLEDGFFSISGAVADKVGKIYFVDRHEQRIYGWSEEDGLTVERDQTLDAVNLAIDDSGNLIVLSSSGPAGTVYSFRPGAPAGEITVLQTVETPKREAVFALPGNYWNNGEFKDQLDPASMQYTTLVEMFRADTTHPTAKAYVSPDGSLILPAVRVFQQGPADDITGWRFSDNLDANGLVSARPQEDIYVVNSSEDRTYRARLKDDGTLDLTPFAARGGESVAVDPEHRVFVANGEIFVFDATGNALGRIDVPERPIDLVMGGKDHHTLFILSHHALFSVTTP